MACVAFRQAFKQSQKEGFRAYNSAFSCAIVSVEHPFEQRYFRRSNLVRSNDTRSYVPLAFDAIHRSGVRPGLLHVRNACGVLGVRMMVPSRAFVTWFR